MTAVDDTVVAAQRIIRGERIRQMRDLAGLTQAQLADACGVVRPTITNIEAGRQTITAEILTALAEALNTTPNQILGFGGTDTALLTRVLGFHRRITADFAEASTLLAAMAESLGGLETAIAAKANPTTEKENHPVDGKTIEIRGVWLVKTPAHLGNEITVLVETADGQHHEAITEVADDGPISHYTHPAGILAAPVRQLVQEHR